MTLHSDISLLWYVVAYFIIMLVFGFYYSTKVQENEDYILAGKTLGTFVLAGTLFATWMGSGSVTGGPASIAYSFGLIPAIMFTIPPIVGIVILYFIAPKIRKLGKYTVASILEEKYGSSSRVLAAIIIIIAYVGIISYQIKGVGFVLNVSTGLPLLWGTIIGAVLIIFLATIGGLRSVAPTDALSASIMLISLLIAAPFLYFFAGGWDQMITKIPKSHLNATGSLSELQLVGYLLPVLFLILGDQNLYQRMAASKDDANARKAKIFWILGVLISSPLIAFIAFVSSSLFANIKPGMALIATTVILPNIAGGLLLAGTTAFIITTGNSFLLSCATTVTHDIIGRFFAKALTDSQLLNLTRILVVLLGGVSFAILNLFPTVLSVQIYAYTVYGAGITPVLLAAVLWKRVNLYGGISSMITGIVLTLVWVFVLDKPYDLNAALVSVPAAIIVLIAGTLLTQSKNLEQSA